MNKLGRADRIKASNAGRKNRLVMGHKNQGFGLGLRNQHAVERIFVRQRQTPRLLGMKGRNRKRLKPRLFDQIQKIIWRFQLTQALLNRKAPKRSPRSRTPRSLHPSTEPQPSLLSDHCLEATTTQRAYRAKAASFTHPKQCGDHDRLTLPCQLTEF